MKLLLRTSAVLMVLALVRLGFAGIRVETTIINRQLEVFFLSDFDINSPTTGPVIFAIDIFNEDAQARQVELKLEIFKDTSERLSNGLSGVFTLQAHEHLRLTNQNLFSSLDPYRLIEYSLDEAGNKLIDSILATGKLPSGTYTFAVVIREIDTPHGVFPANEDIDIVVTNPNTLDLIFPGDPVNAANEDCPELFSTLPQFRWESDFRRFKVVIAEARLGEDPEDALNQRPRFERVLEVGTDIPSTTFQYPSSGEELSLRPGGSYYWRVTGIVSTSSGDVLFPSEIYCFRVANLDDLQSGNRELEILLANLLSSLGIDPKKLFGENGELYGYHPTRVLYNGKKVNLPDLIAKINKLRSNYKGFRVEDQ
ncbi:MAG: hypothetical protein ACE5HO_09510 [bacterium]